MGISGAISVFRYEKRLKSMTESSEDISIFMAERKLVQNTKTSGEPYVSRGGEE